MSKHKPICQLAWKGGQKFSNRVPGTYFIVRTTMTTNKPKVEAWKFQSKSEWYPQRAGQRPSNNGQKIPSRCRWQLQVQKAIFPLVYKHQCFQCLLYHLMILICYGVNPNSWACPTRVFPTCPNSKTFMASAPAAITLVFRLAQSFILQALTRQCSLPTKFSSSSPPVKPPVVP